ncbi:MAG: acyl-CoA synthetase, partial [Bradyrhizobiaceae bacterium]
MIVPDFLWQNERYRPDKIAVIHDHRQFTYAEVARRTRRFANALKKLGIGAGDHVAVLSTNT